MVCFWKMNTEHSVLRIMMDEQLHVSSSLIMLASNEGSQLITLIRMAYEPLFKISQRQRLCTIVGLPWYPQ